MVMRSFLVLWKRLVLRRASKNLLALDRGCSYQTIKVGCARRMILRSAKIR